MGPSRVCVWLVFTLSRLCEVYFAKHVIQASTASSHRVGKCSIEPSKQPRISILQQFMCMSEYLMLNAFEFIGHQGFWTMPWTMNLYSVLFVFAPPGSMMGKRDM